MRIAVCPGSFDPPTFGHLDIIARAAHIFDTILAAVSENTPKEPLFSLQERLEMLRESVRGLGKVQCEPFSGLVVDFAKERGAVAIVRGLRAVSDFEYEFKMAAMNRHLSPDVETVFMMTSSNYSFISSSIVKEVASLGGEVSEWVPPHVALRLGQKFPREGGRRRPVLPDGGGFQR